MNPEYPVYIISKGRWESRLTSKALEKMRVPYHIVIEPQEIDDYAAEIRAFGMATAEADRRIRVNLKRVREAALSELK